MHFFSHSHAVRHRGGRILSRVCSVFAVCAAMAAAAQAQVPGVSEREIVVGSVQDLSGPIAMLGAPVRDGMLLRFEEQNAAGGVHGRTVRLAVEDAARPCWPHASWCSATRCSPFWPTWARRW